MEKRADEVSALMRSLSNRTRLLTLCQLVEGEKSVGELSDALGLAQPAMSQQLAVLRADALVATRRAGQTVYYSLPRGKLRGLMQFLYKNYCV